MKNTTKTTAVATTKKAVATTKKAPIVNASKYDKVLDMEALKSLAHDNKVCFLASDNKSTVYRIFNGKSSIVIQKTQYKAYLTPADFENIRGNKSFEVVENGNKVDGVRPHVAIIKPERIVDFMKVMALNSKNHMQ